MAKEHLCVQLLRIILSHVESKKSCFSVMFSITKHIEPKTMPGPVSKWEPFIFSEGGHPRVAPLDPSPHGPWIATCNIYIYI